MWERDRVRQTVRVGATTPAVPPHRRSSVALLGLLGLLLAAAGLAGATGGAIPDEDAVGSLSVVRAGVVLSRSAADAMAVACVGATLVALLLRRSVDSRAAAAAADRAVVLAAGAWLALIVLGINLRAADALGRSPSQLTLNDLVAWCTRLVAGRGMLATGACALVLLGLAVARVRRAERVPAALPLAIALVGAVLPSVTGHSGDESDQGLGVLAGSLHVAAAALWVGDLACVLVLVAFTHGGTAGGVLLDRVLPRFSTLAGYCLIIMMVSGVLVAAVRIGGWSALRDSGYGWLVLAKSALLVVLAGLGGLTRRRLRGGRRPVLRWAGTELTVMALALGIAAALSQTPPPVGEAAHRDDHDAGPPPAAVDLWVVQLNPLGTVIVDGAYRILYRSDLDANRPSASACVDPVCTAVWEPVLTDERAAAGHGISADLIGAVTRPDGGRQVTLDGWPLYRRVGESGGFTTTGANGTDGVWFAVAPDGAKASG